MGKENNLINNYLCKIRITMNAKVLVLIFLLGFVVEYPIYSQEHNGRTYTIKGAYNLVEFIEMLKEKTGCKITL